MSRENPQSEWLRQDVPDQRIVDNEIWKRVQERRATRGGPQLHHQRRPKRLLSGLLKCGCCGGAFTILQDDRMRCSTVQNSKSCTNTRTVKCSEVEKRVLVALQTYLLEPDVVEKAVEDYRIERERLAKAHQRRKNDLSREAATVERRIKHVLNLIMDGTPDGKRLVRQLDELEVEQNRLNAEQAEMDGPHGVAIHPEAGKRYRAKVAQIHEALTKGDAASREAITILRDLIDYIEVRPTDRPAPVDLRVRGNLAALLVENTPGTGVAVSMVAGAGFEPTTFRL
ncbi:MAG: hypothetical protein HOO99_07680 [Hyphomicrobiaceae bacterium]|nr:hypothetical protein [Hyphomicrobiaceae bacterium]